MRPFVTNLAARVGVLLAATAVLLTTAVQAQAPAWAWGLQSTNPAPADGSMAFGNAVATDAAGRVYVGGEYGQDRFMIPPATRSFSSAGTVGPGVGGLVAQATGAGQWAWVTAFTSSGSTATANRQVRVTSLAVTPAGEVYVAGLVQGRSVLAGGLTASLGSTEEGLFVVRLTSTGTVQWLRAVEGRFVYPNLGLDPSTGGVVLADLYADAPTFGSTTLPANVGLNGDLPVVARLSAAGLWTSAVAAAGTGGFERPSILAVGPAGQVAIGGGQVPGTLTLGGLSRTVPAGPTSRFVVAQLSATNQWQWLTGSTGGDESQLFGLAYARSGRLWASGGGTAGTTVGSLALAPASSPTAPGYAGFVGQLEATGQWRSTQALTTAGPGYAAFGFVQVDAADNAVVLGILGGNAGATQAQVGGQAVAVAANAVSFYVAGLNAAGQWRYVATVPPATPSNNYYTGGIALDAAGNLYLGGGLEGSATFGNDVLMGTPRTTATGFRAGDVILAKLPNAAPLAARFPSVLTPLALYPSPAHHAATLRLSAPAATPETLRIVDGLGRTVWTQTLPVAALETALDLTTLTPGLYLVRVGTATARLVVE